MLIKTRKFIRTGRLRAFTADETGGEKDNINTLLILALIVLPLVFLVITFGKKAKNQANDAWDKVYGKGVQTE